MTAERAVLDARDDLVVAVAVVERAHHFKVRLAAVGTGILVDNQVAGVALVFALFFRNIIQSSCIYLPFSFVPLSNPYYNIAQVINKYLEPAGSMNCDFMDKKARVCGSGRRMPVIYMPVTPIGSGSNAMAAATGSSAS